jgi:4-amino-4-deoxy-L-arabinose transferase-like glycosyltransferase
MSDQGKTVYYIGLVIIAFLWIFVQPVYMPLSFGAGLFLGLAAIVSWQYVCIMSFQEEKVNERTKWSCRNCGHYWGPHHEAFTRFTQVDQCPRCPEEKKDEEEETND